MAAVRHLQFWKLQFWSRVLYWHVILYFRSKFGINRSIWRRDIVKKGFLIWRPSAILNLQNFDFFVKWPSWELRCTSACQIWSNRIILGWDMEIMLFSKWRTSAILSLRKLRFWSRDISASDPSSVFQISRWSANMAPSYSQKRFSIWRPSVILDLLWRPHIASETAFYVPNFVLNFQGVRFRNFWNISYFMFQHFRFKLPISGLILMIFGEK